MRPADPTDPPAASWSAADLVELTVRFANDPTLANTPTPAKGLALAKALALGDELVVAKELALGDELALTKELALAIGPALVRAPAGAGPLTGRAAHARDDVLGLSTAPTRPPWALPLLVTPEVEAWLVGWPAGMVTPVHGHRGAAAALTVVEGSLSEECLDPTIWTTARRTTWKTGASTLFPAGHVHVLGAAGDRPAVAVHAWSRPAPSAGGGAGRLGPGAAAAGRDPGRGCGRAEPVGVGSGRRRSGHCPAGHPAHGGPDLGHVGDRVAG
jgi:quercetin dioxygenase-like cupin family protein